MNTNEAPAAQLLSLSEAAQRLSASLRFVEALIAQGDLAVTRLGAGPRAKRRIPESELVRYVEARTIRHDTVRQVRAAVEGRSTP